MPRKRVVLEVLDDDQKGDEVRIVGGTYTGKTAWLWKDSEPTEFFTPVVILLKVKEGKQKGVYTAIKHDNIAKPISRPTCLGEAILIDHPKIEQLANQLAKKLVMCGVRGDSSSGIFDILKAKIEREYAKQKALGSQALWYHVDYQEKKRKSDGSGDARYNRPAGGMMRLEHAA